MEKKTDSKVLDISSKDCQIRWVWRRQELAEYQHALFSFQVDELKKAETGFQLVLKSCSESLTKADVFLYILRAESTTKVPHNAEVTFFMDPITFPGQAAAVTSLGGLISFWFAGRRQEFARAPAEWSIKFEIVETAALPHRALLFASMLDCTKVDPWSYALSIPALSKEVSSKFKEEVSLTLIDHWKETFGIPPKMYCRVNETHDSTMRIGFYGEGPQTQMLTAARDLVLQFWTLDCEPVSSILREFLLVFEFKKLDEEERQHALCNYIGSSPRSSAGL